MRDDMTDDVVRGVWLPQEGWHELEIVKMTEGTSKAGNSKYTIEFVSTEDYGNGLQQDITNIQGKRWLLRQLIEACGIIPEEIVEEFTGKTRKVYDWEISNIEGKTVYAKIIHEDNNWIDRSGTEHHDKKAKIVEFKKITIETV